MAKRRNGHLRVRIEKEEIKAGGGADWERPDIDGFPSWLVATGRCMPVQHTSVFLGTYGEFASEFGVKYEKPSDDD